MCEYVYIKHGPSLLILVTPSQMLLRKNQDLKCLDIQSFYRHLVIYECSTLPSGWEMVGIHVKNNRNFWCLSISSIVP